MRFKKPQLNDTRIRTEFLLFPKCIDDEVRWLELASWEERWGGDGDVFHGYPDRNCSWEPQRWLDDIVADA